MITKLSQLGTDWKQQQRKVGLILAPDVCSNLVLTKREFILVNKNPNHVAQQQGGTSRRERLLSVMTG